MSKQVAVVSLPVENQKWFLFFSQCIDYQKTDVGLTAAASAEQTYMLYPFIFPQAEGKIRRFFTIVNPAKLIVTQAHIRWWWRQKDPLLFVGLIKVPL